jgi:hypothetical protein
VTIVQQDVVNRSVSSRRLKVWDFLLRALDALVWVGFSACRPHCAWRLNVRNGEQKQESDSQYEGSVRGYATVQTEIRAAFLCVCSN